LEPIANDRGLSMSQPAMSQLAIAWVLQNPDVSAALVGASRPEQVAENAKAAGVSLPEDVMERIDEALDDVVTRDPELVAQPTPQQRPV
jgi:aryl-alcohol dehydrogenase-like predicted oxidoreductase